MESKALRAFCVGVGVLAGLAAAAEANGYRVLGVRSARATALGEAVTAWPDEPAAVVFNPAGLVGLEGTKINVHATFCRGHIQHTGTNGVATRNEDGWQTVPSAFVSSDLGADWLAVGFGASMPNGLSSEWGEDSFARYVATYSELSVADIGPAVGVRLGNRVMLGAGLSYFRSRARLEAMVDAGLAAGFPGAMDVKRRLDGDGDGWGGRVGAILAPADGHRLGIVYQMPFSIAYDGDMSLDGIPAMSIPPQKIPIEAEIGFPAVLSVGYAVEPAKRLRIEVDMDWTLWNAVDDIEVRAKRPGALPDTTMRQDLENACTWKFGVQYLCADRFAMRAGYIYNQNATREATWRPSLPDTDTHFFTLGGGYTVGGVTVDVALQAVHYEKRTIDNNVDNREPTSSVDGTYRSWAPGVSLGLTYSF